MSEDIVAELDRWLEVERRQHHVPPDGAGLIAVAKIERARDEIVALRGYRDECERQFQEQVATTGRLFDRLWLARAEALEEAAQRCDRLGTDYTIPIGQDNHHDGCVSCAAAIRALKLA